MQGHRARVIGVDEVVLFVSVFLWVVDMFVCL